MTKKKNLKNGDPKREKLLKLQMWTWHVGFLGETAIFLPQFLNHLFDAKELRRFYDFMEGQTGVLIGNVPAYYPSDIERFIHNLPNND